MLKELFPRVERWGEIIALSEPMEDREKSRESRLGQDGFHLYVTERKKTN
jgi:hypothetical protein